MQSLDRNRPVLHGEIRAEIRAGKAQAAPRREAAPSGIRRDPAPSRWAYRMQRLWLTPLYRTAFRVGLPIFAIALVAGGYLANDQRRAGAVQALADLRHNFENRPEFLISFVAIEGASPDLADAVRAKLALKLPQSSFDLDMDLLRTQAETLDAVASAELRVRSGGVLQVSLTEREPVLVWRQNDRLELVDATGHRVASVKERADRADLPLIAGEGAIKATAEALEIFEAAAPFSTRVRGLVRVSDRRWDLILDRDQRIKLPAVGAVAAIERLLALDQAQDILARDVLAIDLRNEHRPVLQLAPFAMTETLKARGVIAPTENKL